MSSDARGFLVSVRVKILVRPAAPGMLVKARVCSKRPRLRMLLIVAALVGIAAVVAWRWLAG
ncbi:MAG: hypothetical protein Q8M73_00010 [Actinomycetota bacterium]|nr:hypothetical protein [Candidatus Nanopelagicales bacterium]MDP2286941.1 hypothetical protein [Actinomycetota bacterium]